MCVSQLCYQLSHFPSPIHIFYQIPPLGIRLLGPCFLSVTIVGTAVNNRHSALTHKPITHESYKLKKKKKKLLYFKIQKFGCQYKSTALQIHVHHTHPTVDTPSLRDPWQPFSTDAVCTQRRGTIEGSLPSGTFSTTTSFICQPFLFFFFFCLTLFF